MFNILADIHKRQKTGGAAMLKGINTAGSYFRSVSLALGDRFKGLAGLSEKEIQKLLKSADGKLSYRDEEMVMAGGARPEGTQVRQFGTSIRKDADKLTERSIMDFECIMTSGRKDRDNDILNPAGCEIDKHMPLLWQHVPSEPIGKYVQTVLHDDKIVKIHCAIADTPLGRDSAELAEFGALRISHAFLPIKYAPRDEEEGEGDAPFRSGWNVDKFYVMEASLVSIPANEDAIITAFSREKLHSPLIKEYAGSLFSGRKTTVAGIDLSQLSKGGAINVTVNVGGAAEEKKIEEKKPSDQVAKKEPEEKPAKEDEKKDDKKEEAAGEVVSMGAIADLLAQLGKLDLPDEAKNRLSVVSGMLESVRGAVNEYTDAISAAADDEDLAGLFAGMTELLDEVTGKLGGFCEEAERIASVANLPDSAGEIVSQISSAVGEIQGALSALGTSATDAGSEGAEEEASGEEEGMEDSSMVGDEDGDDDKEDTEEEEEKDEDEDDSELEQEDDSEEDDEEEKYEEDGEDKDDEADEENEKEPVGANDDDVPGWDEDEEDGEEDEDESTGDNEPKSEDDDEEEEDDEAKAASIASKFLGSLIVHEKHDLATLRSIRAEINAKLNAAKP